VQATADLKSLLVLDCDNGDEYRGSGSDAIDGDAGDKRS
jgi:hypothetical protein